MDQRDRQAIELLFEKIARVAQRSGPRDRGADAFINAQISEQPTAPYYMAQTIIMQEKALNEAQARIEELEGHRLEGRGRATAGPWGPTAGLGGGGFLAGAAQTAMGVAGGVLLGNMLADWLMPDVSAETADNTFDLDQPNDVPETDVADAGDFGGGLDFGDF